MWSNLVGESCWGKCKEKGKNKASIIVNKISVIKERPDALQWASRKVFLQISTDGDTPVIPRPLVTGLLAGKEQRFDPRVGVFRG